MNMYSDYRIKQIDFLYTYVSYSNRRTRSSTDIVIVRKMTSYERVLNINIHIIHYIYNTSIYNKSTLH